MKKCLFCLLCLCLVFPLCCTSCGEKTATVYIYVSQVCENYIIGGSSEIEGDMMIMCDAKGEGFQVFDTLKVKYRASDLLEKEGTYTAISGNPAIYQYELTNVISIRKSKPALGEPLYG